MNRRRLMMHRAGTSPVLPAEYQQVEWIKANAPGTYINTLLIPNTANKVRISGKCFKSAWSSNEEAIVRAAAGSKEGIEVGFSATQNRFFCYSGSISAAIVDSRIYGTPIVFDVIVKFDSPQSKSIELNIGGTILSDVNNSSNTRPQEPLTIYRPSIIHRTYFFDGRVYGASFEFDDVLVGNFVPCYRKADGEIGMYDTVSQSFFTNAGTGSFTKGVDL